MKRSVIFIALLLASMPLSAGKWVKSLSTAKAEAKKKNQIIFVDLFADWCGWCHRMEREVFPSEKFQQVTKNMVLLRVDTEDGAEGSRLAQDYQIKQLPTFLMIDPDGMLVGVIHGYAPSEPFSKRVQDQEKVYRKFMKEVEQESSFTSDYDRRLKLATDYIARRGYKPGESRLRTLITEKDVPTSVRDSAYYFLGYSLREQKRYDEAVKALTQFFAVQKKGESLEKGKLLLGQIYADRGNFKAALVELRNFKRTFPRSSFIQNVDNLLPQIENAAAQTN